MMISVLMPVYNNARTINEAINSVLLQTYRFFEIIIVNDGSHDNTEHLINEYKDVRIKYFFQDNADQLSALLKCFEMSSGGILFTLHGDDKLPDEDTFFNAIVGLQDETIDALIGNIYLMDKYSKVYSKLKGFGINNLDHLNSYLHLSLGNNVLNDVAFIRREAFIRITYQNYLTWNMPFWIDLTSEDSKKLIVKSEDFDMLNYRYDKKQGGNYLSSSDGSINVLSGVLRTFVFNSKLVSIPFFPFQRFLFRLFKNKFKPYYSYKPTKNLSKLILKCINVYLTKYEENEYYKSIYLFFSKYNNKTKKILHIDFDLNNDLVYFGKDIRKFNNLLNSKKLNEFYYFLFSNMSEGFNEITTSISNKQNLENVLKFMCLFKHVKINYIDNHMEENFD